MAWQGIEAAKKTIEFPAAQSFFSSKKSIKLIPKTNGNRKRDCAWGCARGINTTWENLQIENTNQEGVRSAHRTDLCFLICRFSQVVFIPRATSRTISFSISNSFWYYLTYGHVGAHGSIFTYICQQQQNPRNGKCQALPTVLGIMKLSIWKKREREREREEIIWNSDDVKPSSVHNLRCRHHSHSINSMLLTPGIWSWQTWHHCILQQHVKKPHSDRSRTLSKPKLHISHTRILETNNFCKSVPNPFAKTNFCEDDFLQILSFCQTYM